MRPPQLSKQKIESDLIKNLQNKEIYLFFFFGASTRFRVMASPYMASRSHSFNTPQSVALLWTSDQPDAETSVWQHTTLTRNRRTWLDSNPQS